MKDDYAIHNLFWKSFNEYVQLDPHLSKLASLPLVYQPPLVEEIPILTPGIYILTGGRQVGKTTTLKLIIKQALKQKRMLPDQIYYLPCDTIKDYSQLLFEIDQFRQSIDQNKSFLLLLDEITYVEEWTRAIKSLADAGFFNHGSVLITGSDSYLLKDAMQSFPGRRGLADEQDFHLFPLSFYEYIALKEHKLCSAFAAMRTEFQKTLTISKPQLDSASLILLQNHFKSYLFTGGYLLAINDFEKNKAIANSTYKTYTQWIIGDMLKRGKNERYLNEIIKSLFPRLSKQVTWHSFAGSLSIEHHQTIIDYFNILNRMDVAIILPALREDKLRAFPKKAKKICFGDPFIFHALRGWANNSKTIYDLSIELVNSSSDLYTGLIEGTIAALFSRQRETYYIKAEGEVDLAIIQQRGFIPIEIKNSLTLNRKDLKQILKYQQGVIGYAGSEIGQFEQLRVLPIPLLGYIAV
ncbi:MAG: ATP-binding protein [Candidatus Margulisbacteria bacterium]|nr:ATP-binding protein [Candidatus Margulisiibacteriota bacterium]